MVEFGIMSLTTLPGSVNDGQGDREGRPYNTNLPVTCIVRATLAVALASNRLPGHHSQNLDDATAQLDKLPNAWYTQMS